MVRNDCSMWQSALTDRREWKAMMIVASVLSAHQALAQAGSGHPASPWGDGPSRAAAPTSDLPSPWRGDRKTDGPKAEVPALSDLWIIPDPGGSPAGTSDIDGTAVPAPLPDAITSIATPVGSAVALDQATLERARARLRGLGFLADADDSDIAFSEALRRFQTSIKVQETGLLDRDTLGRLLVP